MIDGLKVTISGEELRALLDDGVRRHESRASRWTRETMRTKEDETEDAPLLPEHMCENEAERDTWRATVLAFIRDHVDAGETYRLSVAELDEGELLPEKPGWLVQDEYEERTRAGFNLERLVKSARRLEITGALRRGAESERNNAGDFPETLIEETDEFRTTRVDVEGGPEIIKIERK
ncbi:MAG TPA: hypothetical protein VGF24_03115 [Vicinamibacterales bacterium]|jgi:hypothetical protein